MIAALIALILAIFAPTVTTVTAPDGTATVNVHEDGELQYGWVITPEGESSTFAPDEEEEEAPLTGTDAGFVIEPEPLDCTPIPVDFGKIEDEALALLLEQGYFGKAEDGGEFLYAPGC